MPERSAAQRLRSVLYQLASTDNALIGGAHLVYSGVTSLEATLEGAVSMGFREFRDTMEATEEWSEIALGAAVKERELVREFVATLVEAHGDANHEKALAEDAEREAQCREGETDEKSV